jgi:uncharacterized protein YjbI with pentapeptide repeats
MVMKNGGRVKTVWCAVTACVAAGVLVLPVRSQEEKPKPTITDGKQVARQADLAGSEFTEVNLAGSKFEDVNFSKVKMHNINLSDLDLSAAQIGGARFKHIGPPPDKDGKVERQRAVTFEEAQLCDSTFKKVDLSNAKLVDCEMRGMTIDGMPVSALIAAYKKLHK